MADRKIVRALGHRGTVYRAGMEEQLLEAATESGLDLGPFVDSGVLSGDWDHSGYRQSALPKGFPSKDLLEQNGFGSIEAIRAASDEELVVLASVDEKDLPAIRKAVG